jgi:hypothetical protein
MAWCINGAGTRICAHDKLCRHIGQLCGTGPANDRGCSCLHLRSEGVSSMGPCMFGMDYQGVGHAIGLAHPTRLDRQHIGSHGRTHVF